MDIYDDAMPDLRPGDSTEVVVDGHAMRITATDHTVLHSGRRRYVVECVTCGILVHPATTGPRSNVDYHLRNPSDAYPSST